MAILAGPVLQSVNALTNFMSQIIGPLSGGLSPTTSQWLVDQSIYFQVLSVILILGKFFWDVTKENRNRKHEDRIVGLIGALSFLGARLLLVPLIFFASAIPGAVGRMTLSSFAATTTTAKRLADVGDGLVDQVSQFWTLTVEGNAGRILAMSDADGALLTPAQRTATLNIQGTFTTATAGLDNARVAYESAISSGAGASAVQRAKAKLDAAQNTYASMTRVLAQHAAQLAPQFDGTAAEIRDAQAQLKALESLKAKGVTLVATSQPGFSTAAHAGVTHTQTLESAEALLHEDIKQVSAPKEVGLLDVLSAMKDFFGHIGFYACILPALLGMIVAVVLVLKEAIALLQFGAKVDVMKGLAFTFASFFAPLFMITFLFPKTEQFGWKFVNFLFSIFLGTMGVAYVCGVVGTVAMGFLSNQVYVLAAVPTAYLPREASQALFMASLTIGLMAIGIGLMVGFIGQLVQSALRVGQGPFTGNFDV